MNSYSKETTIINLLGDAPMNQKLFGAVPDMTADVW